MNTYSQTLTSKFQIIRNSILDRLQVIDQYSLVIVQAPAGFGKTTLIKQCIDQINNALLVDLYLHYRDKDPLRFFKKLAERISVEIPEADFSHIFPFHKHETLQPDSLAFAFSDAIEQCGRHVVVVLDDFQFIESRLVCDFFDALFSLPSLKLTVAISCRKLPELSLTKLKIEEKLLHLDSKDLAMNVEEVGELNRNMGLNDIQSEDLQRIVRITEGWFAGIKIALMAAESEGVDAIRKFDGMQPDIVNYFGQVVLRSLPEELYWFFLRTSIFERFSAELCDYVLQTSQSKSRLEKLVQGEFFIFREEKQFGWYRYHSLLRDFLATRLEQESPEILCELYRRSAQYFLNTNDLEMALLYAEKTKDTNRGEFYVDTIMKCFDSWARDGHYEQVLGAVSHIDTGLISQNFDLMVRIVCALIFSRSFTQAEYYLDKLNDIYSPDSEANVETYSKTLQFLNLLLQLFKRETDFMQGQHLDFLLELGEFPDIRVFSLAMAAYQHQQQANFHEALTLAGRAKDSLLALNENFIANYAGLIQVLCKRQLGLLGEAIKDVQAEFEKSDKCSPIWVLWGTGMVVVRYDQNQLDEAKSLCEELLPRINSTSATEVIATVYLTFSRLQFHFGRRIKARQLLDKLISIITLGNYERFNSRVAFELLRQSVLNENRQELERFANLAGVQEWVETYSDLHPVCYSESWEYKGLASGWYLISLGRTAQAQRVFTFMRDYMLTFGVKNRVVVYEANITVLQCQTGDMQVRANHLRHLIEKCGIFTLNRTVLDEVYGLEDLFKLANQEKLIEVDDRFKLMFKDVFSCHSISPQTTDSLARVVDRQRPVDDSLEVLTAKEKEILDSVLSGLTNAEISKKTGTSVATVKWHLRNIYSKLHVANRTEAILRINPRASILK